MRCESRELYAWRCVRAVRYPVVDRLSAQLTIPMAVGCRCSSEGAGRVSPMTRLRYNFPRADHREPGNDESSINGRTHSSSLFSINHHHLTARKEKMTTSLDWLKQSGTTVVSDSGDFECEYHRDVLHTPSPLRNSDTHLPSLSLPAIDVYKPQVCLDLLFSLVQIACSR